MEPLNCVPDRLGMLEDVQLLLLGFGVQSSLVAGCGFPGGLLHVDPDFKRHALRIEPHSLRASSMHIGLLDGPKVQLLADMATMSPVCDPEAGHFDRVAALRPLGIQQVFDLTEPVTHSFIANGLTVHNCSEYMFLDDTACNLASLNVLNFFDAGNASPSTSKPSGTPSGCGPSCWKSAC